MILRSDSVTWNPHKLLAAPQQCSTFLTKHQGILSPCHSTNATYLFQVDSFFLFLFLFYFYYFNPPVERQILWHKIRHWRQTHTMWSSCRCLEILVYVACQGYKRIRSAHKSCIWKCRIFHTTNQKSKWFWNGPRTAGMHKYLLLVHTTKLTECSTRRWIPAEDSSRSAKDQRENDERGYDDDDLSTVERQAKLLPISFTKFGSQQRRYVTHCRWDRAIGLRFVKVNHLVVTHMSRLTHKFFFCIYWNARNIIEFSWEMKLWWTKSKLARYSLCSSSWIEFFFEYLEMYLLNKENIWGTTLLCHNFFQSSFF